MSHIGQDKKIVNRVKRLKGQINSIENAIEQPESSCIDILQQVAAIKGAINGLMSELMEQHLHHHVLKGAEVDQNELDEFLKVADSSGKCNSIKTSHNFTRCIPT